MNMVHLQKGWFGRHTNHAGATIGASTYLIRPSSDGKKQALVIMQSELFPTIWLLNTMIEDPDNEGNCIISNTLKTPKDLEHFPNYNL